MKAGKLIVFVLSALSAMTASASQETGTTNGGGKGLVGPKKFARTSDGQLVEMTFISKSQVILKSSFGETQEFDILSVNNSKEITLKARQQDGSLVEPIKIKVLGKQIDDAFFEKK